MSWKTVKDNGIALVFPTGGTDSLRVVFDDRGTDVAYVVSNSHDNGNANAALIAATPQLLCACKRVLDAVVGAVMEVPDDVLLAALDCRRAVACAVSGEANFPDSERVLANRRRDQNKEAQRRCRARKKAAKEATDGPQA